MRPQGEDGHPPAESGQGLALSKLWISATTPVAKLQPNQLMKTDTPDHHRDHLRAEPARWKSRAPGPGRRLLCLPNFCHRCRDDISRDRHRWLRHAHPPAPARDGQVFPSARQSAGQRPHCTPAPTATRPCLLPPTFSPSAPAQRRQWQVGAITLAQHRASRTSLLHPLALLPRLPRKSQGLAACSCCPLPQLPPSAGLASTPVFLLCCFWGLRLPATTPQLPGTDSGLEQTLELALSPASSDLSKLLQCMTSFPFYGKG